MCDVRERVGGRQQQSYFTPIAWVSQALDSLIDSLEYAIEWEEGKNQSTSWKWNFVMCPIKSRRLNEVLLHVKSKIFRLKSFTRAHLKWLLLPKEQRKSSMNYFRAAARVLTICCVVSASTSRSHQSPPLSGKRSQKACKIYWTFWTSSCLNVDFGAREECTLLACISFSLFSDLFFLVLFLFRTALGAVAGGVQSGEPGKIFEKKKDCLTVWTARAESAALRRRCCSGWQEEGIEEF